MESILVRDESGTYLGGALLIGGGCIGGGMFALPVIAGMSGFVPSFVFFVVAWLFMVTTAFFIHRVMQAHPECSNFLSLTRKILGPVGEWVVFLSFISLFLSLVIAYLVKGGGLVQQALEKVATVPGCTGPVLLALVTFFLVVRGIQLIDSLNKVFMVGLAVTFLYLTFLGNQVRDFSFIQRMDWGYSIPTFSFLVISFGFHNLLPSLNSYLGRDKQKVRRAIIVGAMLPFVVYVVWLTHFLSLVPYTGPVSIVVCYESGQIASEALSQILKSSHFSLVLEGFAFFAIVTSLLAQTLSLHDFIQDGLNRIRLRPSRTIIGILVFAPALAIAINNPNIFFQLLEIGGGILAIILFGIFPGLMMLKMKSLAEKKKWFTAVIIVLALSFVVVGAEICKITNS
ncbi:MAG: aromatic amino acid transport family protein [Candidatus Algichlamydia australiensis]|nr:aromatic amino acid transport family protein [Chlamydiales bacterium]